MFDCHTHILPNMDDGSSSVDQSLSMLLSMANTGVSDVFLTPHFNMMTYGSVEEFLLKRQKSFEMLKNAISEVPGDDGEKLSALKFYCGAEVAFSPHISSIDNFSALCIEGTNYILFELPYLLWKKSVYDEIDKIIAQEEIVPVLAHIERYKKINKSFKCYLKLYNMGALMQINAASLMKFRKKRFCFKLIKYDMANLLASDCHNDNLRPPNVHLGYNVIKKRFGESVYKKFIDNPKKLLLRKL